MFFWGSSGLEFGAKKLREGFSLGIIGFLGEFKTGFGFGFGVCFVCFVNGGGLNTWCRI